MKTQMQNNNGHRTLNRVALDILRSTKRQHRPYTPRPLVSLEKAFMVAENERRANGVDVTQRIANIEQAIREAQALRHKEALNLGGF